MQAWRDTDFDQAFLDYGINVFEGSEAEVVAQLQTTGHPLPVALALDEWARIKLYRFGFGTPEFGRLIRMAMALDRDPWRLKLRNAVLSDDRRAFENLAASDEVHNWPPETVAMFVESIYNLRHRLDLIPLLTASHLRHPTNHVIAHLLAWQLMIDGRYEEALNYVNTAHSLRPEFGRVVMLQLNLLMRLHRWDAMTDDYLANRDMYERIDTLEGLEDDDEAHWMTRWISPRIVETMWLRGFDREAVVFLERSLESSPDPSMEHNNLAWYLATHVDPERRDLVKALNHAEALIEIDDSDNAYNTLATVLFQAGRYREALGAVKTSMEKADGGGEFDWLLTAMILEKLGLRDQAREMFSGEGR